MTGDEQENIPQHQPTKSKQHSTSSKQTYTRGHKATETFRPLPQLVMEDDGKPMFNDLTLNTAPTAVVLRPPLSIW